MSKVETCKRKRRFDSKDEAKSAIFPGQKKFMHAYLCDVCGFWHLGHKRFSPENLTKGEKKV
jgi:hypothetical protein